MLHSHYFETQLQTIINNKQRAQQKKIRAELLIVENDIQNRTAEIQAAESQLEFINTSIAEGTKDKVEVVVRRLDLLDIRVAVFYGNLTTVVRHIRLEVVAAIHGISRL